MDRSVGEVSIDRIVITPRYMPAPPRPHMARPIMRLLILGAAPHTAEPTSKMAVVMIYSHLQLNWPYPLLLLTLNISLIREESSYQTSSVLAAPSRKATDSQGSIVRSPNSLMIAGCTSATMVLSRAKRKTQENTDSTGQISCLFCLYWDVLTDEHPGNAVDISWRLRNAQGAMYCLC